MHSLSITRLDPWSHAPANLTIDANLPVKDLTLWCLRSTKTRPKKQDLSVMRLVCLLYNLSVTRQGCHSFWLVNPDLTKKQDLHDMTLVCLQQQPVHSKTGLLLLSVLSTQTWPRKRIVCHVTATTYLLKDSAVTPFCLVNTDLTKKQNLSVMRLVCL